MIGMMGGMGMGGMGGGMGGMGGGMMGGMGGGMRSVPPTDSPFSSLNPGQTPTSADAACRARRLPIPGGRARFAREGRAAPARRYRR